MPKASGIDLDLEAGCVRVCEVEGGSRKFRVLRYVEAEFDPSPGAEDRMEVAAAAVRDLFHEHRIRRDPVAAAMPAADCIVRSIVVPFLGEDQIRKVYRFEAESHLHTCSLDEVIVDYYKVGERGSRSDLLIFAATKKGIGERLELLGEAGIDPLRLGLDSVALFNALGATDSLDREASTLIVDVSRARTSVLVTDGGSLALARVIRIGASAPRPAAPPPEAPPPPEAAPDGESAGDGAAAALEEDPGVAGEFIIVEDDERPAAAQEGTGAAAPGGAGGGSREGDRSRFERRLLTELRRCLATVRLERDPSRILLVGEGTRVPGLADLLSDSLGLPVEVLDLAQGLSSSLEPAQMERLSLTGGTALGLALEQIGHDAIGIDFRQDEFRFQRAFEQVKIVLSSCVSLVAILFLSIFVFLLDRKYDASQPWSVLLSRARSVYEEVLPEDPVEGQGLDAVRTMVGRVEAKNRAYRRRFGGGGGGAFPPLRSAFGILNDVCRGIALARVDGLKLGSMLITQGSVRLTLSVRDSSDSFTLEENLKKASDLFQEVKAGSFKTEKDGGFNFPSFTIDLPEESAR